jgi:hypothetical protein
MAQKSSSLDVYLEVGQKRVFAVASDWPGWCRSGHAEASALQALVDYAPRYARVLRSAGMRFDAPTDPSAFTIVERLNGGANTDFGTISLPPACDVRPATEAEIKRYVALLDACWQAFDAALYAAAGKALRKGPRGGGREAEQIMQHVCDAQKGYLARMGVKVEADADLAQLKQAVTQALLDAPRDGVPSKGPRGGLRWTPHYFARRAAWHILDHAWEIEDRSE